MTGNLFLIHWNAAEAVELAAPLRAAGWQVDIESEDGARASQRVASDQPLAVVIHLARLPSHGRETARHLRSTFDQAALPIIFVGGAKEKVEKVRAAVPQAEFIPGPELLNVLAKLGESGER